jgi:RecB family exonuclease
MALLASGIELRAIADMIRRVRERDLVSLDCFLLAIILMLTRDIKTLYYK